MRSEMVKVEGYRYSAILAACMLGVCLLTFYLLYQLRFYSKDLSSFFNLQYVQIVPVTFLYITAFVAVGVKYNFIKNHVTIPSALFLAVFGFFIYFGTLDHYIQASTGAKFVYEESISAVYNYISIALLCWICGYLLFIGIGDRHTERKTLVWNPKRLYVMTLVWGVIGVASFTVFFARYVKGIPLLQGISPNASAELRDIIEDRGHLISIIAFNSTTMALLFSGVYLLNFKKSWAVITVFFAAIICFLFWGARIYIAFPFLVVFILFAKKKKYKASMIAFFLVGIVMLAALYGVVRNRTFFDIDLGSFRSQSITARLQKLHLAPELRDTMGVISHMDELRQVYSKSDYLEGIYLTALPNKIWNLMGINKKQLFSAEGSGVGWIIADVTRGSQWTGIRPGILGQTLIAFGTGGIIVFFFAGILFSQLDRLSRKYDDSSVSMAYVFFVAVIFSYMIIGMIDSVFLKFWYFSYGYLLTALVAGRKIIIRESEGA